MLKKIKLKNFMSHKSSEFELVKGVNVITGPNNCGKSAVISALQLLADLPVKEGDYMVRHGTSDSEVTVITDEDDELTWQKKGSGTTLIINGEKNIRLQNDRVHYLAKLHQYLKLPRVSGPDKKQDFDIHFATQKDPIFLINDPPSRAALFFASSSDAGRLFEVRNKFKELVKTKKNEQKTSKVTLEEQKKILLQLKPLDDLEVLFKSVQDTYKEFPKDQQILQKGNALLHTFSTYHSEFNVLTFRNQSLQQLTTPPRLEDSKTLKNDLTVLTKRKKEFLLLSRKAKVLQELQPQPALDPSTKLEKHLEALIKSEKNCMRFEKIEAQLATMLPLAKIEETKHLCKLLESIRINSKVKDHLNKAITHFEAIAKPPELDLIFELKHLIVNLFQKTKDEQRLNARLKNLKNLRNIPHVDNLVKAEQTILNLKIMNGHLIHREKYSLNLCHLEKPPQIDKTDECEKVLNKIKKLGALQQVYSKRFNVIDPITPLPEIVACELLEKQLKALNSETKKIAKLTVDFEKADATMQNWITENPTCPSCGGELKLKELELSVCHG